MPCFFPIQGWRSREMGPSGRLKVVFRKSEGYEDLPVQIACGQCNGCRLERSRQWAMRCMHEAELHGENSFITLTYDDDHMPADRSIDVREWQLFMKRLKKAHNGKSIRFFHCGEYGDRTARPHYHACLFGHDFSDKLLYKMVGPNRNLPLYTSETLSRVWGLGFCTIGDVTFESAAYVARYVMKKITGDRADDHYQGRKPEYCTQSRNPGLGRGWFDKFKSDVYPDNFVIVNGKKCRPPKFYDDLLDRLDPIPSHTFEMEVYGTDGRSYTHNHVEYGMNELAQYKGARTRQARKHAWNNTPERLAVRSEVHDRKLQQLKRTMDDD